MIFRRDTGAVSILFFIVAIVIGIVGWGIWYMQFSENETLKRQASDSQASADEVQEKYFMMEKAYASLAKVCGQVPALSDVQLMEPEAWSEELSKNHRAVSEVIRENRNLFEGGADVITLTDVPRPAVAMIDKLRNEIDRLKQDRDQAAADKATAEQANVTQLGAHNEELDKRTQDSDEVRNRLQGQLQQSEEKNETTSRNLGEMTQKHEAAVETHRAELTSMKDKTERLDREVTLFKGHLKIDRAWEHPDGNVIEVDHPRGMAWINLGSRDMLRRGTRFKVFGVKKGGVKEYRGWVLVHDIKSNRALCSVEKGEAIRPGDFVTNPWFDKGHRKIFHFLGNLPGRFDNQTAKSILESFGAQVAPKLSLHVDFIVLGDNPDPDAEIGPDADLNWFKSTVEYNDCLRWGIEFIRARDLETYLQY